MSKQQELEKIQAERSAPKLHVIIPAAGTGSRMGSGIPKQYLKLHGETLIQHVIKVFEQSIKIHSVHIILSVTDTYWCNDYLGVSKKSVVHYCGGETRAQTVLKALNEITPQVAITDWVLVHDAARPGLNNGLLDYLISTLEHDDVGGLLALPLADTLKRANQQGKVKETIPRDALWQAQTPQMFKFDMLKTALEQFVGSPTDEAEAIEALGFKPTLVKGELQNMKVTYSQDLSILSMLFSTIKGEI